MRADVWLNGRRIGGHTGAYLPFELPAAGIRRGSNELLVRVDGHASPDDIPPAGRSRGWWNYGGILREVYLRKVLRARPRRPAGHGHLARSGAGDGQRAGAQREFGVAGERRRAGGQRAERLQLVAAAERPDARRQAGWAPCRGSSRSPDAALWSPASPSLYLLKLRLPGGQVTQTPLRRAHVEQDAGRAAAPQRAAAELRGASFHEDTLAHGAALTPADETTIADELTALGADFARQHYPPSPQLLEAFDRLGIVFWEQIPVWRLRGSDLVSPRLRPVILDRLRQTLLRDRNHASVMAWSVENEVVRGGADESRFLDQAKALVRRLDPTRFFAVDQTVTAHGVLPAYYSKLDALGISEYMGWYGHDPVSSVRPALDALRARLPGVALFVTEFGAEANRSGPATTKGTYAFQRQWLDQQLTRDRPDALPRRGDRLAAPRLCGPAGLERRQSATVAAVRQEGTARPERQAEARLGSGETALRIGSPTMTHLGC